MKAIANKSFWLFVAWLVSVPARAADGTTISEIAAAAKRTGDKSREALVSIYGNVVNNPLAGETPVAIPSSRAFSRYSTAHCWWLGRFGLATSFLES